MTLFVAPAAFAQTVPPPTTPPVGQKPTPPPVPQTAKPPAPAPVPFPADVKIGFVNMQYVVSESKYGKAGTDKLNALRTKREADNQGRIKQLQTLQNELNTQATVMAPAILQQKQQEVSRLQAQLQFEQQQLQVDAEALENQLMQDFGEKVLPIVEQIRKEKNLWAIFTSGNGSNVAALMPGIDISADVIKILDGGK
ncbi:MAG TPA: OmpH family outer membrane protein [Vicinamibacterales bacterium]|nr:OmpH family outer membrane protein [Vicinamibacterales bacterium]